MHRTTVMLPEELKHQATKQAQKLGISLGELIRQSLNSFLHQPVCEHYSDSFLADDAVFPGSTPTDLAENHDAYLYGEKS